MKKSRFYYVCFEASGYNQHNAITDNPYYFKLYIRDRERIINDSCSLSHVGYVDAINSPDAIDIINRMYPSVGMTSLAEIQFLSLGYHDYPFAATADEMDIIDEAVSYNDGFDISSTLEILFRSVMHLHKIIQILFLSDTGIPETMEKSFGIFCWYIYVLILLMDFVDDAASIPEELVDKIYVYFDNREYETVMLLEKRMAYYEIIDYAFNYFSTIIGDAFPREFPTSKTAYDYALLDDII